jgi:hypothetical protein
MLTTLYPNFAIFHDDTREVEDMTIFQRRYKFISARGGCMAPSSDDLKNGCRIKLREDHPKNLKAEKVIVHTPDGTEEVYMWKTYWSVYNTSLNAWVPVIDYINTRDMFPGESPFTVENDKPSDFVIRRVRKQSLRIRMIDNITKATETPALPCPIPRFVAELIKKSATEKGEACAISMNNFSECRSTTLTACYHLFETDAIDQWLRTSKKCPVCKQVVTSRLIV